MKRLFLFLSFLVLVVCASADVHAQTTSYTARRIIKAASLPATCTVGDVYFKTAATIGTYECKTANNWTAMGGGSGTVTSVSVTTANGVSGSVATATTTPAITLTLGVITPTSVAVTASPGFISTFASSNTSLGAAADQVTIKNTDTTNNNYASISFLNDQGSSGVSLLSKYTDHTAGAQTSTFNVMTRVGGSFALRATVDSTGLNLPTGETFQVNGTNILSAYLPLAGGTLTGNLLFTDNTLDIGASGATRPRTGYFGTSVIAPTGTFATGVTVAGAAITNNIVQNSQSAAYTTVLADAGKHIYHPSADTTARTFTIDSNANVAYPIGTVITIVNDCSAGVVTIAITSDTLVLAGAGTTGSRTLAACGVATAIKVTSTRWVINGTGLT